MAIPRNIGRLLGWTLLAGLVAVILGGCHQRDESNPFIGPNGSSLSQPFG